MKAKQASTKDRQDRNEPLTARELDEWEQDILEQWEVIKSQQREFASKISEREGE